jgi:hypothetical protein
LFVAAGPNQAWNYVDRNYILTQSHSQPIAGGRETELDGKTLKFSGLAPCDNRNRGYSNLAIRNERPRLPRRLAPRRRTEREVCLVAWWSFGLAARNLDLARTKLPAYGFCRRWGCGGLGGMPLARAAKPLKRLKTAMGSYWKSRYGFGVGAAPAWGPRLIAPGDFACLISL